MKELSPYEKIFYDKQGDTKTTQEIVPETPIHAITEEAQKLKEVVEKPSQQWCGQQLTVEIATMENLYKRKVVLAPICPICKLEPETCLWTSQIWKAHTQNLIESPQLWCIWKDRNHFIFRKIPLNPYHTLFKVSTS